MARALVLGVLAGAVTAAACGGKPEAPPPAAPPVETTIPLGELGTVGALPNGVTYAIVPPGDGETSPDRTEVVLAIRAGAADEAAADQGAAHALAHVLGTETPRDGSTRLDAALETSAVGQVVTDFSTGTDPELLGAPLVRMRRLLDGPLPADADLAAQLAALHTDVPATAALPPPHTPHDQPHAYFAQLTPAALRAFRAAWYRPDAIAVIVVSAAPADRVRAQIERAFGNLPAASAPPTAPPPDAPSPAPAIEYRPGEAVQVTYRVPSSPIATEAGQRARMLDRAITNTVTARLRDQRVELACTREPVSATTDEIACSAHATDPDVSAAVAIATEIERIRRHGLSHAAALDTLADYVILPEPGAHSRPGGRYADYFLGAHLPRTPAIAAALTTISRSITADEIAAAARTDFDPAHRRIAIDGAGDADATAKAIAAVEATAPPPWDHRDALAGIVAPPAPAAIAHEDRRGEATVWTLANGARVVVLPHAPKGDGWVAAFGPGGWASAPPEDAQGTIHALRILDHGGLGDVPVATYRAIARETGLGLDDEIRATRHTVQAWVPHAENLEVAFAAIYALHARAHADPAAIAAWRTELHGVFAKSPADAASDAAEVARHKFLGDIVPPGTWDGATVDHLDAARAIAAYHTALGDVGASTFVVGTELPIERVRDLAARYLATIPRTPAAPIAAPPPAPLATRDAALAVATADTPSSPASVTWVAARTPGDSAIVDQLDTLALEAALGGEKIADHSAYPWSRITDAGHLAFGIELWGESEPAATLRDPVLAAMRAIATRGPSISQLARAKDAAATGPRADRWLRLVATAAATGIDPVDAATADLRALARLDAAHVTATAKRFVHHFVVVAAPRAGAKPGLIDL